MLGADFVSCAFKLKVVYCVSPNYCCGLFKTLSAVFPRDCAAKLMHALACAAAGFEVMTASFLSSVYMGL
jgi:hypothetical protein